MAKENNVNTILADIYQISADINIQNTPNLIPNESLFTLRMFYSFYGAFFRLFCLCNHWNLSYKM